MKPAVWERSKTQHSGGSKAREVSRSSPVAEATYVALALGHVHGVLNIRRNGHHVVYRLPLFLLVFRFVHFLQRKKKTKNKSEGRSHDEGAAMFLPDTWEAAVLR